MYVFPASHFKMQAAIEVFFPVFLFWAASILLLAVSYFLQLSALANEKLYGLLGSVAKGPKFRPQTIQISFQKLLLVLLSTGILNFLLPFWLI
jgi:hypothetical protein